MLVFFCCLIQQLRNRMIVDQSILQQFIKQNRRLSQFAKYLANLQLQNNLNITPISQRKLIKACKSMNSRTSSHKTGKIFQEGIPILAWKKGQFQIFSSFLYYYLFIKGKSAEQLKNQDFEFLSTIFTTKPPCRLKYEVRCLFVTAEDLKKDWTSQEIQLLKQVLSGWKEAKDLQWKCICYQLFEYSQGKFFRTYDRCREMWTNHVNPDIKHKAWTLQEDCMLLSLVQEIGKHWAKIVSKLGGRRTDHMVKNRYNALVLNWGKRKGNEKQLLAKTIAKLQSQIGLKSSLSGILPLSNNPDQQVHPQEARLSKMEIQQPQQDLDPQVFVQKYARFMDTDKEVRLPFVMDRGRELEDIYEYFPQLSKVALYDYHNQEQFKPIMIDITEKLGLSHVEQVDFLFDDYYGQRSEFQEMSY